MSRIPETQQDAEMGQITDAIPELEAGDHLDQPTFHQRYEAMPEGTRAELIGGMVYMPSPCKRRHSFHHGLVYLWATQYRRATQGTEVHLTATNLMGPESEPQPDVCLLISPSCGGQTGVKDDYIVGAPELIIEVASSTESIDLHAMKKDYEKAGVKEYVVVALRQRRVYWFCLRNDAFVEAPADPDGLMRSAGFPGLWLDPAALLAADEDRVLAAVSAGLASPEHGAFVARLATARSEKLS
jgi:Uma2 family endonuclease